jgi:ankyrin repeat protein
MQAPMELSLLEKITKGKVEAALKLIDLVNNDDDGARLDSVDSEGKSFLNHALNSGLKTVADRLFELQLNEPDVLFKTDESQQNCLMLAAKHGYTDIVKILIKNRKKPSLTLLVTKFG